MHGVWGRTDDRRPFALAIAALVALAWVSLWAWGRSPYGRYLNHQSLEEVSGNAFLILAFVVGWTVMIVAMMLPTSLPLVMMFHAVARRTRLVLLQVAGYLGVWMLFGALVYLTDWGLHAAVERVSWLEPNAWVIGPATLILAGVYQYTPLKYRCLDKCRSPFSFIIEHWRGGNQIVQALRLGIHHGVFCLGCCWSLMLVMFAVGAGNLGWMLALGGVMAVEKNVPWGRQVSAPLGLMLMGSGLIAGVAGAW